MTLFKLLKKNLWIIICGGCALASPYPQWLDEEGVLLEQVVNWIEPLMTTTGIKPRSWHISDVNAALQGFPPSDEKEKSQNSSPKILERSKLRWFQDGERLDMNTVVTDAQLALQVLKSLSEPFHLKKGRSVENLGDVIVILGTTAPRVHEAVDHVNTLLIKADKEGKSIPLVYFAVGKRSLFEHEKKYMKEVYQAEVDDEIQMASVIAARDLKMPEGSFFTVLNGEADPTRKRATTATTIEMLLADLKKKGVVGDNAASTITLTLTMASPFGDYQWLVTERVIKNSGIEGVVCQVEEMPCKEYLLLERALEHNSMAAPKDKIINWANIGLDNIARTFYELNAEYQRRKKDLEEKSDEKL